MGVVAAQDATGPPGAPAPGDPLTVRDQVVRATYACVARFGMAKTTVEDVVKESGLSRATIYRHFPGGREELLHEAVAWQVGEFFVRLADHVRDAPDLAHLLDDGLAFARRALGEHELLQRILQTEPERLLGLLTTESTKTLPFIAAFLEPYLERERVAGRLRAGVEVAEAASHLARLVLSYIGGPGWADLDDPAQRRDLVERELLGGVLRRP
jgi:AcrR family transcriptional regulator